MPVNCYLKNTAFSFFLSLHHPNNHSENIFYLPLINSAAKKIFLGKKKFQRGNFPFLHPPA